MIIGIMAMFGLNEAYAQTTSEASKDKKGQVVKLRVTGMTCAGCNSQLSKLLSETAGVIDNSVEYPGDIAVIQYDPEKIKHDEIMRIIEEKTAYKAEVYKEKSKSKT